MKLFKLASSLLLIVAISMTSYAAGTRDDITIKPGYPLPDDAATLKENLKLNRGIELFLWSLPLNQSYAGRDGMLEASGGSLLDVTYIGGFADHTVTMSTFNNETVYATVHLELYDGPVVYEQPAMDKKGYLFGSIIDVWQVALTDIGVPGGTPDQGKGVEFFLNTASEDALGTGAWTVAPLIFLGFFNPLGPGSIFVPGYQHTISIDEDDGRSKVRTGLIDMFLVKTFRGNQFWGYIDPQIILDYENDKEFMNLELQAGMMTDKYFGTKGQSAYIMPSLGVGTDRPYDYSLEVGYKVVW